MVKKSQKPYVVKRTARGRTYYYFERAGTRIRLPDNPESREFDRAYWEIMSGKAAPVKTSFDALIISYYQSSRFKALAKGTQANYRRHIERIREKNGKQDFRKLRRRDVIAARDQYADQWSKANELVAVLSILADHAIDLEWITHNPAKGIKKLKGGEYEPWPDSKLKAYEIVCKKLNLTAALTAYELGIGTGQRIGDFSNMLWDDFDGEYMAVVQEKTKAKIWVYCPTRLQLYLSTLPKQGKHIFARNLTQPIGKRAVQKAVEEARRMIGVMHGPGRLVPHGWRYTAAVQLAEAGCSDSEIQAVTGHKTLEMVQKYRAQANQRRTSKSAQKRRERNENET